MKEVVGNVQYASLLYDFYGGLLGEKQLEIMDLYHEDNLSLSEIAEELGMTRQAVHYTLKKAEARLETYEEALGLIKKYTENENRIAEARALLEGVLAAATDSRQTENLNRVLNIIEELAE